MPRLAAIPVLRDLLKKSTVAGSRRYYKLVTTEYFKGLTELPRSLRSCQNLFINAFQALSDLYPRQGALWNREIRCPLIELFQKPRCFAGGSQGTISGTLSEGNPRPWQVAEQQGTSTGSGFQC